MRRYFLSAMAKYFVVLVLSKTNGQATIFLQAEQHQYSKGGSYTIYLHPTAQQRQRIESQAREYLWRKWHNHESGKIDITRFSKEGEKIKSSYFVMLDENGEWKVDIVVNSYLVSRGKMKSRWVTTRRHVVYILERIKVKQNSSTSREIISADTEEVSTSYTLVLKDKGGKLIEEI